MHLVPLPPAESEVGQRGLAGPAESWPSRTTLDGGWPLAYYLAILAAVVACANFTAGYWWGYWRGCRRSHTLNPKSSESPPREPGGKPTDRDFNEGFEFPLAHGSPPRRARGGRSRHRPK